MTSGEKMPEPKENPFQRMGEAAARAAGAAAAGSKATAALGATLRDHQIERAARELAIEPDRLRRALDLEEAVRSVEARGWYVAKSKDSAWEVARIKGPGAIGGTLTEAVKALKVRLAEKGES